MVAPPPQQPKQLPAGWIRCGNCKAELQTSALFVVQLFEPLVTANDAEELIPNPDAGKLAEVDGVKIVGHLCAQCQAPIWPE